MTENPNPSSSTTANQKVKTLVLQGMIGAVSLTGATAIPIVVQRFLAPPPAVTNSTIQAPATTNSTMAAPVVTPTPAQTEAVLPTQETQNIEPDPSDRKDKQDKHRERERRGKD